MRPERFDHLVDGPLHRRGRRRRDGGSFDGWRRGSPPIRGGRGGGRGVRTLRDQRYWSVMVTSELLVFPTSLLMTDPPVMPWYAPVPPEMGTLLPFSSRFVDTPSA